MGSPAERVVLLGSKSLGAAFLRFLTDTDPGRLAGLVTIDDRGDERSTWDELHRVALAANVTVHVAADKRDSERILAELAPDLALVAGWYWILSPSVLDAARYGYFGVHNSLLPRYRGSSPLVWALINGDEVVGLSFFRFTTGMDDGPLIGQREVVVADRYVAEVTADLERSALGLLAVTYADLVDGRITGVPQATTGATYAAARLPEDGRIDWTLPAGALQRFVRAQSHPYPGAWTSLEDRTLTIWRATALATSWSATPGQVVGFEDSSVLVGCGGRTVLRVEMVSTAGDAVVEARRVLRSLRLRLASRG